MYILKNKKKLIIIIAIVVVCSIAIAIAVKATITNSKVVEPNTVKEQEQNKKELNEIEDNFKYIFQNSLIGENQDLVYLAYDIKTEETAKYDININIPMLDIQSSDAKKVNKEITDIFVQKLISIKSESETNTVYNIDYQAYINENVLSLIIRCNLKEGNNPSRTIIKTYNYDIEENKILTLEDLLNDKELNKEGVQQEIDDKIKQEASANEIYERDINDKMYKIENTTEFFMGENKILYIIYAYGNDNYTSEKDLVIIL